MNIYIIMQWDNGEKYPTGIAFWNEEDAKEHCKGSEGWTEYEEVELQGKAPVCDDCRERLAGPSPF